MRVVHGARCRPPVGAHRGNAASVPTQPPCLIIRASVWLAVLLPFAIAGAAPSVDERVHVDGAACGVALSVRVQAQLEAAAASEVTDVQARADALLQQRPDGQWQLDLVLASQSTTTERTFVASSCETVMDAAAFVIAIAFDPSRAQESTEPTSPAVPEPETPPMPEVAGDREAAAVRAASPATAAAPRPAPRARARRFGGFVRAGGGVDFGALPRAAAVFEIATGLRAKWWRLEALGAYRLATVDRAKLDATAGGQFWSWTVGARGCGVPSVRAFELPICAGIDGGQLVAKGFGFADASTTRRPWVAAVLSPGFAWAVHPHAALTTRIDVGVPLVKSTIEIENLEVLHRVRAAYGRVWIGVEGRFP